MKVGTRIEVESIDKDGNRTWLPARIARRRPFTASRPDTNPDGYRRIRFDDGARLIVHESRFRAV